MRLWCSTWVESRFEARYSIRSFNKNNVETCVHKLCRWRRQSNVNYFTQATLFLPRNVSMYASSWLSSKYFYLLKTKHQLISKRISSKSAAEMDHGGSYELKWLIGAGYYQSGLYGWKLLPIYISRCCYWLLFRERAHNLVSCCSHNLSGSRNPPALSTSFSQHM